MKGTDIRCNTYAKGAKLAEFPTAILQRVLSASVKVDKEVVSSIGKGVLVFAAMAPGDTDKEAAALAAKVLKLKLWDDDNGGRWKNSVQDINGEVLCGESWPNRGLDPSP
jgi:D-aminoacyl-tRNA deacylase